MDKEGCTPAGPVGKLDCEAVVSPRLPPPVGPYSHAVRAGDLIFVSGLISMDRKTGRVVCDRVDSQVHRILENLEVLLGDLGGGLSDVVRTTIYCVDLSDFGAINRVYAEYFAQAPPARSTLQVAALPGGVAVEIDAIAHIPR